MIRLPKTKIMLLAGSALAGALAFGSAAQAVNHSAEHGKELAEINCSRCHAIGNEGDSPHDKAPPFRTLSERLKVDTIDEVLLTKATPAHSDMPAFVAEPDQIDRKSVV